MGRDKGLVVSEDKKLEILMANSIFVPSRNMLRVDRKQYTGFFHKTFSTTHVLNRIEREILDSLSKGITLTDVDALARARQIETKSLKAFLSYLITDKLILPIKSKEESEYFKKIQLRYKEEKKSGIPLRHVYLMLTSDCNLACRYCLVRSEQYLRQAKQSVMSKDLARSAIDYMCKKSFFQNDYGVALDFFGGEPLLHKELIRYCVEYIHKHSHTRRLFWTRPNRLAISTNGWLIDEDFALFCKSYNIGVSVSLDGVEREQAVLRPNRNTSAKYTDLIRHLQMLERSGIMNGISVCVTRNNIKQLPSFIRWLGKRFKTRSILLSHMKASSNPRAMEHAVGPVGHEKDYNNLYAAIREEKFEAVDYNAIYSSLQKGKPQFCNCGVNGSVVLLDPDGYAYPCPGLAGTSERIKFDPRKDLTKSGLYKKWSLVTPWTMKDCYEKCEIFTICGGKCAAHRINMRNNFQHGNDIWCDVNRDLFHRALSDYVDNIWRGNEYRNEEII